MIARPEPDDYITPRENAALLRQHRGGLDLAFGPSGVWLARDGASGAVISAWAPPLLALWRGEAVCDGGGI